MARCVRQGRAAGTRTGAGPAQPSAAQHGTAQHGTAQQERSAASTSYSYGCPQVSSFTSAVSRPLCASSATLRRGQRGRQAEHHITVSAPPCRLPANHPPTHPHSPWQRLHHKVVVHVAVPLHHTGQHGVALAGGRRLHAGRCKGGSHQGQAGARHPQPVCLHASHAAAPAPAPASAPCTWASVCWGMGCRGEVRVKKKWGGRNTRPAPSYTSPPSPST